MVYPLFSQYMPICMIYPGYPPGRPTCIRCPFYPQGMPTPSGASYLYSMPTLPKGLPQGLCTRFSIFLPRFKLSRQESSAEIQCTKLTCYILHVVFYITVFRFHRMFLVTYLSLVVLMEMWIFSWTVLKNISSLVFRQ